MGILTTLVLKGVVGKAGGVVADLIVPGSGEVAAKVVASTLKLAVGTSSAETDSGDRDGLSSAIDILTDIETS